MTLSDVTQAAEARRTADTAYRSAVLAATKTHGLGEVAKAAGVTKQAVSQLVKRHKEDTQWAGNTTTEDAPTQASAVTQATV